MNWFYQLSVTVMLPKKKKNIKEHTPNWSQFPFHQHRILIIKGSGSGKTNWLFNVISQQTDIIDKIYLYGKYPYEAKYHFFTNKRESTRLMHLSDAKAFIPYSNDMDDI